MLVCCSWAGLSRSTTSTSHETTVLKAAAPRGAPIKEAQDVLVGDRVAVGVGDASSGASREMSSRH